MGEGEVIFCGWYVRDWRYGIVRTNAGPKAHPNARCEGGWFADLQHHGYRGRAARRADSGTGHASGTQALAQTTAGMPDRAGLSPAKLPSSCSAQSPALRSRERSPSLRRADSDYQMWLDRA